MASRWGHATGPTHRHPLALADLAGARALAVLELLDGEGVVHLDEVDVLQAQVEGARIGPAHMVGAGGVCLSHVLKRS